MSIHFIDQHYCWKTTSLEEFLSTHTPSNWTTFFNTPDVIDNIRTISNVLRYEASHDAVVIYPPINNVFRALYCTDPDSIKVVIIGQDPYHDGAATGIAFDVDPSRKQNPSLRNIKKEAVSNGYQATRLLEWTSQGVLLLNTALTVRAKCPGSHAEIWESVIIKLINFIEKSQPQIVWLLMGSHAHQYEQHIGSSHIVVRTTHPSPLAAARSTKRADAFIGSGCFTQINSHLKKLSRAPIQF